MENGEGEGGRKVEDSDREGGRKVEEGGGRWRKVARRLRKVKEGGRKGRWRKVEQGGGRHIISRIEPFMGKVLIARNFLFLICHKVKGQLVRERLLSVGADITSYLLIFTHDLARQNCPIRRNLRRERLRRGMEGEAFVLRVDCSD